MEKEGQYTRQRRGDEYPAGPLMHEGTGQVWGITQMTAAKGAQTGVGGREAGTHSEHGYFICVMGITLPLLLGGSTAAARKKRLWQNMQLTSAKLIMKP